LNFNRGWKIYGCASPWQNYYFVFIPFGMIALISNKQELVLDGLGDIDGCFLFVFTAFSEEKGQMSRAALAAAEGPYEQEKKNGSF
jgi:hypothetical protein